MSTEGTAYKQLVELLTQVASVIDSLSELQLYVPYDSPAEFSAHVRKLAIRLQSQEHAALRDLVPIFAPTGAWDDATGFGGMEMANRIMGLLDQLKWSAEGKIGGHPCL